ncbi:MAG: hypothetical protein ACAH17_03755 [Candidatus Paceibacterota bacterium]
MKNLARCLFAFALIAFYVEGSFTNIETREGKVLSHTYSINQKYPKIEVVGDVKKAQLPVAGYMNKHSLLLQDSRTKEFVTVLCSSDRFNQKDGSKISYVVETSLFLSMERKKLCV